MFKLMNRKSARRFGAGFMRGRRGVAAVEFAILCPILVGMLLGSIEITHRLWAAGKINDVASVIGDLISQEETLDDTKFRKVLVAGPLLLDPYDAATLKIEITSAISCYKNGNTNTTPKFFVTWSRGQRWSTGPGGSAPVGSTIPGPYAVNSVFPEQPTDLALDQGDTVIFTKATFSYKPDVHYYLSSAPTPITRTSYFQPRKTTRIPYSGVETTPQRTCAQYFP